MSFSRPSQRYHSYVDLIWPDGTFKTCVYSLVFRLNFLYSFDCILVLRTRITRITLVCPDLGILVEH